MEYSSVQKIILNKFVYHEESIKINFLLLYTTLIIQNKLKSKYTIILHVIINCFEFLNIPKSKFILMDFENAAISITKDIFGDSVQVKGCNFHLCESMGRKYQQIGFSSVYKNNRINNTYNY